MAESKLKLVVQQGATFRKRMTWKTGTPAALVDLAGYTARMQIRGEIEDAVALLELTTENSRITLGGAAGTIDLYISADDTAEITWESGVYDLELVAPGANGDVIRLVSGSVVVSPEVTRP